MSIQSEIERINTSVTAAYAVLEGLGATMPETQNIDNLAATAATLPTGTTTKLLWENASPASDFAAQNINVDSEGYDAIKVIGCHASAAQEALYSCYIDKINSYSALFRNGTHNYTSRPVRWLSTSQIQFYNCDLLTYGNENGTALNSQMIPLRIYGIKGVS